MTTRYVMKFIRHGSMDAVVLEYSNWFSYAYATIRLTSIISSVYGKGVRMFDNKATGTLDFLIVVDNELVPIFSYWSKRVR